tara:strand:- start:8078 stop:8671 length:594 start_codon:yes stop_codon:yes gene_type:complete
MINYNSMSDETLVQFIKSQENTEECLDVLIQRHSGLCIEMINSFISQSYNESLRRELIRDKDYQIYCSALKFDPDRGSKFSTYLGNEIKWKCLNLYNKSKKRKTVPVEEDVIEYFSYSNKNKEESNVDLFLNIISHAKKFPDKRIGKIFNLRYVVGKNNSVMPWRMVSNQIKMSIQGCINLHNTAITQIRKKIDKEI